MTGEQKVRVLIRALIQLLAKEKAALKTHAYDRIRKLAGEKHSLVQALSAVALADSSEATRTSLVEALEELRVKAEENAVLMEAVRGGVADARARLEAVAAARGQSGFYAEHGAPVECAVGGAVARNV